jgi:biopolymer transport protein ExbD
MWSPSQAAIQRERRRRPHFFSGVDLWPFVGISLVLLIIFMVIVPPPPHNYAIDLPRTVHATVQTKASREDAIRITIMKDGSVYYRNKRTISGDLAKRIQGAVQEGAEKKVYLAVDVRSRYRDTVAVVDQIREAGISEMCILAERAERF